ncbi:MAG: SufD family Fe-S cluster assembly protein [Syntrophomonadaceae bacterium]|nr:SufD family Fe-S cluster assembly protein [Syntrophomonadaceae bacterium]
MQEELRQKALKALNNAPSEEEINIASFEAGGKEHPYLENIQELPEEEKKDMLVAGVDTTEKERAGTFILEDNSVIHASAFQEGLEVMGTADALDKYDWLHDLYWNLVEVDRDKYTAKAALEGDRGYFIRALPGAKAIYPLQACMFIGREGLLQSAHNIIIAEEGSDLNIITGCTTASHIGSGMHIGITEIYVRKNAKLTFTMIHNWGEEVVVRPRTVSVVEDGGTYLSNYISMTPVRTVQMYPTTYLKGKNSVARYHSIIVGYPNSDIDVGSQVVLQGEGSRAEIIARSLTRGGRIVNRGRLVGEQVGAKGHLECRGLMLAPEGVIYAVPELEARVDGVELSHEAAVGKIAQEEIEYLMARGLSEDEATAMIVRGFLNVKIMGLPEELDAEVRKAIAMSDESDF